MAHEIEYGMNSVSNFRLLSFATGSYMGKCRTCGKEFIGDKLARTCLACAIEAAEAKFTSTNIMAAIDFDVWWAKQADLTYDEKVAAELAFNAAIEIMEAGRTVPAKRRVQQLQAKNTRNRYRNG